MIAAKRDVLENDFVLPDYGQNKADYLRVVEKEHKNKQAALKKDKIVLVAGILCMFSLGLLYTFMAAKITMGGYTINSLKAEINTIETQNHRLTLEIEEKSSLKNIENIAKTKLGMIAPNDTGVYYLAMEKDLVIASNTQTEQGKTETATENNQVKEEKNTHPILLALNKLFFE